MKSEKTIYGILAEFKDGSHLVEAVETIRHAGYTKLDAFSPFPMHELSHALGIKRTSLSFLVLMGGLFGLLCGFMLQYYVSVIVYPYNIGGRPLNSWPAFIPVTFEVGILFASLTAVLGMLALNGLPMPYHPIFNVHEFTSGRNDRFFVVIEEHDPKFHLTETKQFLKSLNPDFIFEIEL